MELKKKEKIRRESNLLESYKKRLNGEITEMEKRARAGGIPLHERNALLESIMRKEEKLKRVEEELEKKI
jgi:hypothetical protein